LQNALPDWQPNIVIYRRARIAALIADARKAIKANDAPDGAKQGAGKP
jgi:hypothetical protein